MRALQRRWLVRLLVALVLGAAIALGLWWAGRVATLAVACALLVLVLYAALSIAPDAIAHGRGHHWRWAWRLGWWDGGPDRWLGTRVPRRPRPPCMPPRAAAARPEREWPPV